MNQAHSRKALLCMIPQTLERAAYYGTRALLVLFMINNIGFSRTDALYIYGTITSLAYIMKFLGGLVGDLAIGNKLAFIIGQTLTIAGILTLLNQSISGIYISAGLLALGSGMANVNMFSEISKEYSGKDNDIESGMTLLYVFTNLGAFLGICLSSVYESYQTTIILMAIIALFSLISYLLIPQESQGFHLAEEKVLDQKEGPNRMTGVGVAALFVMGIASLIYWSCFEYLGGTMTIHIYEMGKRITNPEINATSLFLDTNSVTIVISGIILALVLVKKRFTPFTKGGIGLIFFSVAIIFFGLLVKSDLNPLLIIILAQVFLSLSELFIAPAILSLYVKKIPKKRLALGFGLGSLFIALGNSGISKLPFMWQSDEPNYFFFITPVVIILCAIGIPFFFLDRAFEKAESPFEANESIDLDDELV